MTRQGRRFRPDIQALRALAVMLVVIYHFWPSILPGGYIGVDVFFVVSGYLITAHLVKEIEMSGRIRLGTFWAGRARRLLPAALLVLVVVSVAVIVFVPQTRWLDYFREVIPSIFYVENWNLAAMSVDYLAADNDPSPVQHYWTLSLEEQFYVVWPLLLLSCAWFAARVRRASVRRILPIVLLLILVTSFGISLWMTARIPAQAYFATPSRVWEFCAGALVGFMSIRGGSRLLAIRTVSAWTGLVAIAAGAFLLTQATPFPGWAALVPVLGAAAVIWGGSGAAGRGSLGAVFNVPPVQMLGRISYSLYLWHWPPLIIIPLVLWRPLTLPELMALLLTTVALSWLTERWVERPVRDPRVTWLRSPGITFRAVAGGMALCLLLPAYGVISVVASTHQSEASVAERLASDPCFGALSSINRCAESAEPGLLPLAAAWQDDSNGAWQCYNEVPWEHEAEPCSFGSNSPNAIRVAIVGDSHAAMIVPALRDIASEMDLHVDQYLARLCVWVDTADSTFQSECESYRDGLTRTLASSGYDLVIVTGARAVVLTADRPAVWIARARIAAWKTVLDSGTSILAIGDNPRQDEDSIQCIERAWPQPTELCGVPASIGLNIDDSTLLASKMDDRIVSIDNTGMLCPDGFCPSIIGGVAAYFDTHHLTATFTRSLAPRIQDAIAIALH